MKRVLEFLKDRRVIIFIGLLALSILIWFVGPYVRFGESNYAPLGSTTARLIAIMILVGIWGLNNLRVQFMNKKHNDELIGGIETSQVGASNPDGEVSTEELALLNDRFKEAMGSLKKLRFKGKRGTSKAVYELPWYIIIGPPGSGKTTALINSGLEFPLEEKYGEAALKGVGGTRNCDWWFTNEAVLLDTAGRYTTQDSHRVVDSTAWQGFLALLKKNRRRRPINGAIIAFSLQDMLMYTEDERARHAKTIRLRIDELMEQLGVRFPIYLMFTKVDLVSGFTEFFDNTGKGEREQVWGVTFDDTPDPTQAADINWFSSQYDSLITRLNQRVLWRVHEERDMRRRGAIQAFPQQMESLKASVVDFLKQAFASSRYHSQPYLRGVYLTSGTQDGTPIDRLMSSVAANFGLPRDGGQQQSGKGKSFFISRMFKEIVFPESDLVGTNKRFETAMVWGQRAAYAGLAALVLGLLVTWAGAITRNKMLLNEVSAQVVIYEKAAASVERRPDDAKALVPALDALREASRVYGREEHLWLSTLGLFDTSVAENAKKAYRAKLAALMTPLLLSDLERYMKTPGVENRDLYNALRLYVSMKKTKHFDAAEASDWFNDQWGQQFPRDESTRQGLERHLSVLLDPEEKLMTPQELNARVLANARAPLLRVPTAQRVYDTIRSKPEYRRVLDLREELGDQFRRSFNVRGDDRRVMGMPVLFTRAGYKSVNIDESSELIGRAAREDWVLSDDDRPVEDISERELEKLREDVKTLYLKDYAAHWNRFLDALEINKFKGVSDAEKKLAALTDPVYSPITAVLELVVDNTRLTYQPPLDALGGEGSGAGAKLAGAAGGLLAARLEGNYVDKEFKDLIKLMTPSKRGPAPIDPVMEAIKEEHNYVYELANQPDSSKAAFEAAKAHSQGGGLDVFGRLRQQAGGMPQPVKGWMLSMADQGWGVVRGSAKHHLNVEWREQVYSKYKRALAGRYPLSRNSRDDLALYDFAEFFKPEGTLDVFAAEYLSPFIDTKKRTWKQKPGSIGISPAALAQLNRANRIKKAFFQTDPSMPGFSMQIKPFRMDRDVAKFELEMGGRKIDYSHGPKIWRDMSWPGEDSSSRARIIFEDLSYDSSSTTYEGPWAWFRLLDASSLRRTQGSNVYRVSFAVKPHGRIEAHKAEFDIKAKSVDNPFSSNLLSAFRCPEAL